MNKHRLQNKRERGQAVVLVALMALTLVLFVGLALDGAQVYQKRRQMQNAADAGAYVGARELSVGSSSALIASKINTYTVGGNGIGNGAGSYVGTYLPSGTSVKTGSPAANDNCVRVSAQVTFPTFMIGLVGFDNLDAVARATACFGPIISSDTPLWPLLIHTPTITTPYTYGQPVAIFNDPNNPDAAGSQFGWADFDGGSNPTGDTEQWLDTYYTGTFYISDYVSSICNGSNGRSVPMVSVGDCLNGDPGLAVTGKIKTILDAKKGISVTVLIYETANGTGSNSRYHIVGFGRFKFLDYCLKGGCDPRVITGTFEKWVGPGEICITGCSTTFGATGVSLSN